MWLFWLTSVAVLAGEPPWNSAMRVGDCARVLAELTSPGSDVERLAAGACALRRGSKDEGLNILSAISAPSVKGYANLLRASALVEMGRPEEAMELTSGLQLPGAAGLEARLVYGQAGVAAGRSLDVREALRELLTTAVSHEARFWLALGGEDRGATAAAIATYRRVWAESTRGPWAERAAEALKRLENPVPDYDTEHGRTLVSERARALARDNQHGAALELRRNLHEQQAADGGGDSLAIARASFRGKDYEAANRHFGRALGAPATSKGSPRDLFEYGLGHARLGDYETAGTIYERLWTLHPSDARADEASYKIGFMAWDKADCAGAVNAISEHLARYPSSRHADEALWFRANCLSRLNRIEEARADWQALIKRFPRSSLAAGAHYWTARSTRDDAERVTALEDVVRRYPVSAYAYFALQKLDRSLPSREVVARPAWPSPFDARPDVQRAEALLAAGFPTWARDELSSVVADAQKAGRNPTLAAAHALIAAGDYRGARKLAAPYCVSPWKEGDPVAQQACTPRPEASVVSSIASEYGLNSLLPYGIMTSESALDPSVTSPAGARGLMQLMPAEAARVHQTRFGWAFDSDDLYRAPYNAALGTSELGMRHQSLEGLLDRDSLPAVIASYNAGEDAVRRWTSEWSVPPEPDTWSEQVSYTETRRYVKGVLGHLMRYRWVYGDPP